MVLYYETGYKSTWLTDDLEDAQAWRGLYPIERNPMDILKSDGGVVVGENLHPRLMGNLESRQAPLAYIGEKFKPRLTLQTKLPVFPFSMEELDTLEVYLIRPGEWQYDGGR